RGARWRRQVEHGIPRGDAPASASAHWFRITDSLASEGSPSLPAKILWHIRGDAKRVSATEWRFTQEGVNLDMRVSGATVAVERYEEPAQLNVGTGCPPEAYQLCWGQPFWQVVLVPEAHADATERSVTTEFRIAP